MPIRRRRLATILLCLGCLAMTTCSNERSDRPSRTDPSIQDARAGMLERKELARVPPEPPARIEGEVPGDLMTRIRQHLAARLNVAADSFEVVRAEARQWPNGAMGCPQPGMNYTQAIVPGYWIVLRHDGRDYDYRASRSGYFVACEGIALEHPPTA